MYFGMAGIFSLHGIEIEVCMRMAQTDFFNCKEFLSTVSKKPYPSLPPVQKLLLPILKSLLQPILLINI